MEATMRRCLEEDMCATAEQAYVGKMANNSLRVLASKRANEDKLQVNL